LEFAAVAFPSGQLKLTGRLAYRHPDRSIQKELNI